MATPEPLHGQLLSTRPVSSTSASADIGQHIAQLAAAAEHQAYIRGEEAARNQALAYAAKLEADAAEHAGRAERSLDDRDYATVTLHSNKAAQAAYAAAMIRRAVTGVL